MERTNIWMHVLASRLEVVGTIMYQEYIPPILNATFVRN